MYNITSIYPNIQQFHLISPSTYDEESRTYSVSLESRQNSCDVHCPHCHASMHVYDRATTTLKDMPPLPDRLSVVLVHYHRYRCPVCGETATETIGFKYPGSRITTRAAAWVTALLFRHASIKDVHELTGIHWDTIKTIHKKLMQDVLTKNRQTLAAKGYKPTFLAVDEFALHKGQKYATCVMDFERGDIIWVGKGRSKREFAHFFEDVGMEYLSNVKAVAMDMNASFHTLFTERLPEATIVYDTFHMLAQFGREVLGTVRLEEAREHEQRANELKAQSKGMDKETAALLHNQAKEEHASYKLLKGSRWAILRNSDNLTDKQKESLSQILGSHEKLLICHAMKEELNELFQLRDPEEAKIRWRNWFDACEESGIEALVKFGRRKRKRLEGLIAHALYPIHTGRLEGRNNKIKVSKRIAFGYRDEDYFFTLIQYLSLPKEEIQLNISSLF